ncbi:hypothetical protein HPB49_004951 [Dermacentor silvarum]|uniref:Uncharacterized protein n=1 Tax=Dermacentor silvarum TaxID=543639 RepID=A0ACB8DV97_DERSI|nr:hypothetical protein HPB49_004951 [Dermacentor silvarum]
MAVADDSYKFVIRQRSLARLWTTRRTPTGRHNCVGLARRTRNSVEPEPHFSSAGNPAAELCTAYFFFLTVIIDVGAQDRHSDGGVFKATSFGKDLKKNCLNLPAPARLPRSNKVASRIFVGDEAFQLRQDFMRP